jgi:hypothetical protein
MKIIRIGVLRGARYRLQREVATSGTADPSPTCGSCTWGRDSGDGGLRCAFLAPEGGEGPTVAAETSGCPHHERILDCDGCGACCREAFDSVPVAEDDEAIRRHPALLRRHADGWCDLARVASPTGRGTRCAALHGDGAAHPYRCRVYADRPTACAELQIGSDGCLFARRRVGLTGVARHSGVAYPIASS